MYFVLQNKPIKAITLLWPKAKNSTQKSCSGARLRGGAPALWRSSGGPGFYYPIPWRWSFPVGKTPGENQSLPKKIHKKIPKSRQDLQTPVSNQLSCRIPNYPSAADLELELQFEQEVFAIIRNKNVPFIPADPKALVGAAEEQSELISWDGAGKKGNYWAGEKKGITELGKLSCLPRVLLPHAPEGAFGSQKMGISQQEEPCTARIPRQGSTLLFLKVIFNQILFLIVIIRMEINKKPIFPHFCLIQSWANVSFVLTFFAFL